MNHSANNGRHRRPLVAWAGLLVAVAGCASGTRVLPATSAQTAAQASATTASAPVEATTAPATSASTQGAATSALSTPTAAPTVAPTLAPTAPSLAKFNVVSVTFVSLRSGWVLGTTDPNACSAAPCAVALLQTRDGGATWRTVPTPRANINRGPSEGGVAQVRFANLNDGWISGGDLWVTHDGGAHWRQITSLPGSGPTLSVTALETNGSQVYAAYWDGGGNRVDLASTDVRAERWTVSPTALGGGAGPVNHTMLVLQGSAGWAIQWDRVFADGARLGRGTWTGWRGPCGGLSGGVMVAASTASDLVAVCDDRLGASDPGTLTSRIAVSSDGGSSFTRTATAPFTGFDAAATPAPGVVVTASSGYPDAGVLRRSADGGKSWVTAATAPLGPAGVASNTGFTDLGFTSATQGVVVTPDGRLLMTHDGGRSWTPVVLRSAA